MTDGIEVHSTALRLNGGENPGERRTASPRRWTIAAEDRHPQRRRDQRRRWIRRCWSHPVTGGVCDRTPVVSNGIVACIVRVNGVELCSQVTAAHLSGITERLSVERPDLAQAVGDFAGLSGLQRIFTINGTWHRYAAGGSVRRAGQPGGGNCCQVCDNPDGADAPAEGHLPRARQGLAAAIWRANSLLQRPISTGICARAVCRTASSSRLPMSRNGSGRVGQEEPRSSATRASPAFFSGEAYVAPSLSPRAADAGSGRDVVGGPDGDPGRARGTTAASGGRT